MAKLTWKRAGDAWYVSADGRFTITGVRHWAAWTLYDKKAATPADAPIGHLVRSHVKLAVAKAIAAEILEEELTSLLA